MTVLDTDVVSTLMRPRPPASLQSRLAAIPPSEQCTTAVTIGELAYGAARAGRPELFERAMQLLRDVVVLPFDKQAAEQYGRIRAQLERAGQRLDDPDLRIAAIVLAHGAVLVTGNTRHFVRVPGLNVEDWLHP